MLCPERNESNKLLNQMDSTSAELLVISNGTEKFRK